MGFAMDKIKNIELISLFSDNMVFQRQMNVPVWGTAAAGQTITVNFAGQKKTTQADKKGNWQVLLDPMEAGGPYILEISGPQKIRYKNVLVGEVWIGSGQSNMEMPLAGWGKVDNYESEIAQADYPMIRLLQVKRTISSKPEKGLPADGWQICSPATIPEFSSTAYFFGRKLFNELNVPIGLIHSSWGGTIIEAWISGESLKKYPEFAGAIPRPEQHASDSGYDLDITLFNEQLLAWHEMIRGLDPGYNDPVGTWFRNENSDPGWGKINIPVIWQRAGLNGFDGFVWIRRNVDIPDTWQNTDLVLQLAAIEGIESVYFNSELVGGRIIWDSIREYTIPAKLVRPGGNSIVVRINKSGGEGSVWGNPELLRLRKDDENAIPLAGEWQYRFGLEVKDAPPPPEFPQNPNFPTLLSNAMIEPLIPFAIRGVIWYQGESNAGRAHQYRQLFPELINDWRRRWGGQDFPFLFVQLANWLETAPDPDDNDWAELREAQLMTLAVKNTGMAVAIDIGDAYDIHPKNKQAVGQRLALNALKMVYNKDVVASGPLYRSMAINNSQIILAFDHIAEGLATPEHIALKGFAIAGKDHLFHWADAVISGNQVIVSNPSVPEPVAVRYAWAINPDCNLYNSAGLPASPFRTDQWPGVTEGNK